MRRSLAVLGLLIATSSRVGAYDPRVNWQLQCMGCHQPDGSGERGRVPSLRETLVPFSMRSDGRQFVMRVPGVAQSALSDAEVAALLNWLVRNIGEKPVPADFREYTTEEVSASRHHPLVAVKAERVRLLDSMRIEDVRQSPENPIAGR